MEKPAEPATEQEPVAAPSAMDVLAEITGAGMGQLRTRMVVRDFAGLKLLEQNARYMKAPVFNQLVSNIKRDGVLTSVPLVYADEVLSGNHRVQGAIKAGIARGFVLEILGQLSDEGRDRLLERDRRVSIQLSHNSLVGEDDPNILADLYRPLPIDEKLYSGVTDDALKAPDPLTLASLSAGATAYEEVQLLFLPEDRAILEKIVERLNKKSRKPASVQMVDLASWDQIFDAVVKVKAQFNVYNTALAFRRMAELALERIEQLEPEEPAESNGTAAVGS